MKSIIIAFLEAVRARLVGYGEVSLRRAEARTSSNKLIMNEYSELTACLQNPVLLSSR